MIKLENYGWIIECKWSCHPGKAKSNLDALVTPAFYGAGMLSGLNASWSFCE